MPQRKVLRAHLGLEHRRIAVGAEQVDDRLVRKGVLVGVVDGDRVADGEVDVDGQAVRRGDPGDEPLDPLLTATRLSSESVRRVASKTASSGMMFSLVPPAIRPTVTTTGSKTSKRCA